MCHLLKIKETWSRESINNEDEINLRVYQFPTSAIEYEGKKISCAHFIASGVEEDCNTVISLGT